MHWSSGKGLSVSALASAAYRAGAASTKRVRPVAPVPFHALVRHAVFRKPRGQPPGPELVDPRLRPGPRPRHRPPQPILVLLRRVAAEQVRVGPARQGESDFPFRVRMVWMNFG